jgi:hypothetical protein
MQMIASMEKTTKLDLGAVDALFANLPSREVIIQRLDELDAEKKKLAKLLRLASRGQQSGVVTASNT